MASPADQTLEDMLAAAMSEEEDEIATAPVHSDSCGTTDVEAASTALDSSTAVNTSSDGVRDVFGDTFEDEVANGDFLDGTKHVQCEPCGGTEIDDGMGKDEEDLFGSDDEAPKGEPSAENPATYASPAPGSVRSQAETEDGSFIGGASFVDESRFTTGPDGVRMFKWKVEYATRAGGGRAQCRDTDCMERKEQAGSKCIEKGHLRICHRVRHASGHDDKPEIWVLWYHARCLFNTFTRARRNTRVIETIEDIEGFTDIRTEDQDMLRRFIAGNVDLRGYKSSVLGPALNASTPDQKRGGVDFDAPSAKRPKQSLGEKILEARGPLKKGDRVWTHCRVRPTTVQQPDRPGAMVDTAIKSPKPELATIFEELRDGSVIVQFESAAHEKERLEKFQLKKYKRIKAWLRYPRQFEGKKQRVPLGWVQVSRPPPRLCSCLKQEWGHNCDSGIACGRGTQKAVFGVCQ